MMRPIIRERSQRASVMIEKRSYPRVEVTHPVFYSNDIRPNPGLGSTIDLSMGGTRIETLYNLMKGEYIEISIVLHPQVIKSKGEVVDVLQPNDRKLKARIRFAEMSEQDRLYLEEYLSHVMEQRKASKESIGNGMEDWSPSEDFSECRIIPSLSRALEAQERERKLLAQELHDKIGDPLAATKFDLERKLNHMPDNFPLRGPSLGDIISMIQDVIENVREISTNLWPFVLDDLGILATIQWYCREFPRIYPGIRIKKEINVKENEVPKPLKIKIYRVLQEALTNIAKHSKADSVRLCLKKTEDTIELSIRDNGQGFDMQEGLCEEGSIGSIGIFSAKERAELSGGIFSIESQKGSGTAIRASWPRQKG